MPVVFDLDDVNRVTADFHKDRARSRVKCVIDKFLSCNECLSSGLIREPMWSIYLGD